MGSPHSGMVFLMGLVAGFIISFLAMNYGDSLALATTPRSAIGDSSILLSDRSGLRVFPNASEDEMGHHAFGQPINHDAVNEADRKFLEENREALDVGHDVHKHAHDDDTVARDLYHKVRVLVWVMTQPSSLESKARHVNHTWGRRANKVLYASDEYNPKFPTIPIKIQHGRDHLTAKTMAAFDYVYEHHLDDFDWFMKADDDTYVIMENLRYFLSDESSDDPVFFGHWFKVIVKQGYYSGGGGYVLSREALRRFGARDKNLCQKDHGAEDVAFGKCMESLGVRTQGSLDNLGRSRFHCFNPENHRRGGFPDWYLKYDKYNGTHRGVSGMSDYPITFHYCSIEVMYDLEYYVYHLKPYGIKSGLQDLNIHKQQDTAPQHEHEGEGHDNPPAEEEKPQKEDEKKNDVVETQIDTKDKQEEQKPRETKDAGENEAKQEQGKKWQKHSDIDTQKVDTAR